MRILVSGKSLALLVTFLMFSVGFGILYLAYTNTFEFEFNVLVIAGASGILGLVLMIKVLVAFGRNWYWHELTKYHFLGFFIIIIIILILLWYYGVLEWFL